MINKLKPGTVYLHEAEGAPILAQVGLGGDCGIFSPIGDIEHIGAIEKALLKPPLFRVIVVERDVRKWKKGGEFPLSPFLNSYQTYYEKDVYPEKWYISSLENPEDRREVSKEEAESHEPLSFWATAHVVRRLDGENLFR